MKIYDITKHPEYKGPRSGQIDPDTWEMKDTAAPRPPQYLVVVGRKPKAQILVVTKDSLHDFDHLQGDARTAGSRANWVMSSPPKPQGGESRDQATNRATTIAKLIDMPFLTQLS